MHFAHIIGPEFRALGTGIAFPGLAKKAGKNVSDRITDPGRGQSGAVSYLQAVPAGTSCVTSQLLKS